MTLALLIWTARSPAACPVHLPADIATDLRAGARLLVAWKGEHELAVYEGGTLSSKCYRIKMAGGFWDGPKLQRGDNRTPEGWYTILERNPASEYYRSLRISYPNADDVRRSLQAGVITPAVADRLTGQVAAGQPPDQDTELGGDIFIHGNPHNYVNDWTLGCISLANADMAAIYAVADPGTPLLILAGLEASP